MTHNKTMTISDLLEIEPRIKEIIPIVKYEENWDFAYVKAKQKGENLVGWFCSNEDLQNCYSYELFIDYICDELDKIRFGE